MLRDILCTDKTLPYNALVRDNKQESSGIADNRHDACCTSVTHFLYEQRSLTLCSTGRQKAYSSKNDLSGSLKVTGTGAYMADTANAAPLFG